MAQSVREVVVKISADDADYDKTMQKIGNTTSTTANQMSSVFESNNAKIAAAGAALSVGVTAPIVAGVNTAINTFADYDSKLREFKGTVGDAFQTSDMERFDALALKLGADTSFSATQAVDGFVSMASAGFELNEVYDNTGDVLNLAAGGSLEVGRAAEVAAAQYKMFGDQGISVAHITDVMTKAAAVSAAGAEEMAAGFARSGNIASTLKQPYDQTAAALAALNDNQIKGEAAGTALNGIFASMATQSGPATDALKKYGLTFDDINPATNDLATIIDRLKSKNMEFGDAVKLVGREGAPALMALVKTGGDGLRTLATEFQNSEGYAKQMADEMTGGFAGARDAFGGAIESLQIKVGRLVGEAITPLMNAGSGLITKISEAPTPILAVGVGLAGLAAAAGPVMVGIAGIGAVGPSFRTGMSMIRLATSSAKTSMLGLAGSMGPVLIVAALVAGAAYLIYKNWDVVGPKLSGAFDRISTAAGPLITRIQDLVDKGFAVLGPIVSEVGTVVGDYFVFAAGKAIDMIEDIAVVAIWLADGGLTILSGAWTAVTNVAETFAKMGGIALAAMKGDWGGVIDGTKSLFEEVPKAAEKPLTVDTPEVAKTGMQNTAAAVEESRTGLLDSMVSAMTGATVATQPVLENNMAGYAATGAENTRLALVAGTGDIGEDLLTGTTGAVTATQTTLEGGMAGYAATGVANAQTAITDNCPNLATTAGTCGTNAVNAYGNVVGPGYSQKTKEALEGAVIETVTGQAKIEKALTDSSGNQSTIITKNNANIISINHDAQNQRIAQTQDEFRKTNQAVATGLSQKGQEYVTSNAKIVQENKQIYGTELPLIFTGGMGLAQRVIHRGLVDVHRYFTDNAGSVNATTNSTFKTVVPQNATQGMQTTATATSGGLATIQRYFGLGRTQIDATTGGTFKTDIPKNATTGMDSTGRITSGGMDSILGFIKTGGDASNESIAGNMSAIQRNTNTNMNASSATTNRNMRSMSQTVNTNTSAMNRSFSTSLNSIYQNLQKWGRDSIASVSSTVKNIQQQIKNISAAAQTKFESAKSSISNNSIVQSASSTVRNAQASISNAGRSAGNGFISNLSNSIKSGVNKARSVASSVTSAISRYLPRSPAKEGALSVLPDFTGHLVTPILAQEPHVKAAISRIANVAATPLKSNYDFSIRSNTLSPTLYNTDRFGGNGHVTNNNGDHITVYIEKMPVDAKSSLEDVVYIVKKELSRGNSMRLA